MESNGRDAGQVFWSALQVEVDRRRLALEAETAGVAAAMAAAKEARDALGEADAGIARLSVVLGEQTIHAPVNGQIEYKIIEKDAVITGRRARRIAA